MDQLQLYRGTDTTCNGIVVHVPTLGEICDYGEQEFFSMAHLMCAIPTDYMDTLEDQGIHYEDVDEYEFFATSIFPTLRTMHIELLFPKMNASKMMLYEKQQTNELVLYDKETDIYLDKSVYQELVELVRQMCGIKYNPRFAGTALTRQKMIEVARMQKMQMQTSNKNKSILLPLISALVNCADFKYSHAEVWDMPIYAFMDAVKRVGVVRSSNQMYIGGYFGLKLTEVKQYLDWMRPL